MCMQYTQRDGGTRRSGDVQKVCVANELGGCNCKTRSIEGVMQSWCIKEFAVKEREERPNSLVRDHAWKDGSVLPSPAHFRKHTLQRLHPNLFWLYDFAQVLFISLFVPRSQIGNFPDPLNLSLFFADMDVMFLFMFCNHSLKFLYF